MTNSMPNSTSYKLWALLPLLLLLGASQAYAAATAGYTRYFIPGDEDSIQSIFSDFGNTDTTSHSIIAVTAWTDNITIYYDHWEDGYDFDPADPTTADETVVLANRGDVHVFESTSIPLPRTTAQYYDGRDFIYVAGGTTTVTRAAWLEPTGTVQSIAWEVYPLKPQLTTYILPFGENLTNTDFDRVYTLIQATTDNTVVTVDLNGDGTPDNLDQNRDGTCDAAPEIYLNAGDVFLLEDASLCSGTLNSGTVIQGNDTLQLQYVTGSSANGNYEIRGLTAFPRGFWDDEYYAPVDGMASANTDLFLYNPHSTPLTINYDTADATVGSGSFTLAAGETLSFFDGTGYYVPDNSGVHLKGSDVFWGVSSIDTNSPSSDWGYSLVPASMLNDEYFMGWAPGSYPVGAAPGTSDPDSNSASDSGLFITSAQDNTTVNVDFDNDGIADRTYLLNLFETQYVWDPDGDVSGANIWATGQITVAYGQNRDTASPYSPAIDVGYTSIPGMDFVDLVLKIDKTADPVVVGTAAGSQSTYTITLNSFDYSADSITIADTLPSGWEYVSGSTTITLADLSQVSGAAADPGFVLYADSFNSITYSNNSENLPTGTTWASGWIEDNDDASPSGGNIQIQSDTGVTPNVNALWFGNSDGTHRYIARIADLSGAAQAVLSFDYRRDSLENATDSVIVQVCEDANNTTPISCNGSWVDVLDIDGSVTGTDSEYQHYQVKLTTLGINPNSSTLALRFDSDDLDSSFFDHDYVHIRNIQLETPLSWPSSLLGNMAENQQITVEFTAQTTQDFTTGTITRNQVEASGTRIVAGVSQTFTTMDSAFNTYGALDIAKTTSGTDPRYPGDQFTYTVTVTNPSSATTSLSGIAIYDPIPSGTQYVVGSGQVTSPVAVAYGDSFSAGFNNQNDNTGGVTWASDWVRNSTRDIFIENDLGSDRLRVRDNGREVGRQADLSGFSQAILSFDYRRGIAYNSGYVEVQACQTSTSTSTCSSGWVTVYSFPYGNDSNYTNVSFDLNDASILNGNANSAAFALRIVTAANSMGNDDGVWFDNIKIDLGTQLETLSSQDPPNFVESSDGYSLAPGQTLTLSYDVTIDDPLAAGITSVTNVASVNSNEITLPVDTEVTNIVVNPSSSMATVGELVWMDSNGDGVKDVGESGLSGVDLILKDQYGTPIATTTTNSTGNYQFTGIPAGNGYYVEVSGGLPAGVSQSAPTGHSDDRSDTFALVDGQDYTGANLGYAPDPGSATFGNLVWSDADGDGIADAGEPGLAGITVALYLDDGDGVFNPSSDTLVTSTTTATDGSYLITGITPTGSLDYFVFVDSAQTALGGYTESTGTSLLNYDVAAGDVLLNNDIGFQPNTGSAYSIQDRVWYDADGDGVADLTESGIAGVTADLLDASSNIIASATTDSNGDIVFSGVPAGANYTVKITDTGGVLNNYYGTTSAAVARETVIVNLSGNVSNTSFGYNITATVGDTVFHDLNGDGTQDAGEPGFSSVVVELQDGSCTPGSDCPTLTTDSNGSYLFSGLADGSYMVYVDPSQSALSGYQLTTPAGSPSDSRSVTVSGGSTDLTIDYGYATPAASTLDFSGTIWDDANNDGSMDSGESGLQNITLEILDSSDNVIQSATTDSSGNYQFNGLLGGGNTYTIRITDTNGALSGYVETWEIGVPAGDTCSSGSYTCNDAAESLSSTSSTVHFGYYKAVPTLAVIASFDAFVDNGQVVIQWVTASESGTVGFFLKRLNRATGKFKRVNRHLLPGLLNSPSGGTYQYVDTGAIPGRTYTYKLVEVEVGKKRRSYGPYTVSTPAAGTTATTVRQKGDKSATKLSSSGYSRKAHRDSTQFRSKKKRKKRALSRRKRGQDQFKITVQDNGMYCLETAGLAEVSGLSEARLQRLIRKKRIFLNSREREISWLPMDDSTGFCFYGTGRDSLYGDENVYWLNLGRGKVMDTVDGGATNPVDGQMFTETLHAEEDVWPTTDLFDDPESDYWFWDFIFCGWPGWDSKQFVIHTDGVAVTTGSATLKINFKGATDTEAVQDHHVQIDLNGTRLGEGRWNGTDAYTAELTFDQGLLLEGDNTVTITGLLGDDVPYSIFYVDAFDLSYQRLYTAIDDRLDFSGGENEVISVDGFTTEDIQIFDITEPENPTQITGLGIDATVNGYRATFKPTAQDLRYVAVTSTAMATPETAMVDFPRLKRKRNKVDYLVISPAELKDGAQELADYREGLGYRTMVVELDEIYNCFNDGLSGPDAIHNLLTYAYKYWKRAPQYVVLVGKGTYDYKNLQGYGDNLMPPQMVNTGDGLFPSDTALADVEGNDGLPEMAIGRLPVTSVEELTTLIEKIKGYEAGGGDWVSKVTMTSDNPDEAGDFVTDSDAVASLMPSSYLVEKITLAEQTTAEARNQLINGINSGMLLLNYLGHGGMDRLAAEGLLLSSDVAGLTNGDKLPLLTAMTCLAGRFGFPGYDSITEVLLLHDNGGTIASWAPTSLTEHSESVILNKELFKAIFQDDQKVVGDALLQAMQGYSEQGGKKYILNVYALLGDPALRLW